MFTYISSSVSEENFSLVEELAIRLASSISGPLLIQPVTLHANYNRHLIYLPHLFFPVSFA